MVTTLPGLDLNNSVHFQFEAKFFSSVLCDFFANRWFVVWAEENYNLLPAELNLLTVRNQRWSFLSRWALKSCLVWAIYFYFAFERFWKVGDHFLHMNPHSLWLIYFRIPNAVVFCRFRWRQNWSENIFDLVSIWGVPNQLLAVEDLIIWLIKVKCLINSYENVKIVLHESLSYKKVIPFLYGVYDHRMKIF